MYTWFRVAALVSTSEVDDEDCESVVSHLTSVMDDDSDFLSEAESSIYCLGLVGDVYARRIQKLLHACQPYPGDQYEPDDQQEYFQTHPHFVVTTDDGVMYETVDLLRGTQAYLHYARVSFTSFSIGCWYAAIKAEHESTRGSPGSVPAGISTPKTHTWIRAGMFPRVTWIRGSITCGFAGTCHSTGRNRYLQVYPQVNIFFTV